MSLFSQVGAGFHGYSVVVSSSIQGAEVQPGGPEAMRPAAGGSVDAALYRDLFDALPAAVYVTDREGRITKYNEAAVELWGGEPKPGDRWCGSARLYRPDGAALPLDECPMAVALREARAVVGEEIIVERPDGSRRSVLPSPRPLHDEQGNVVGAVNVLVDATDRHQADSARKTVERALRESEARFREVANTAPVMIWISGLDKLRHWFNRRWLDFVGRTTEDEKGLGWTAGVHPDDLQRYLDMYHKAFDARVPFAMEYRLRRSDGEFRWILANGTPMHNADGEFTGFIGTCADITERKRTEQELALYRVELEKRIEERTRELTSSHERLRTAERLAMMGTLAAGLGHDMGNLLVPVRVRLDSLTAQTLSPQAREDVEAIRTSAEYLRRLATGLRMLSLDPQRSHTGDVTDIVEWWTDAAGVLKSVLPRGISLESRLAAAERCRVGLSKAALTQVVFNLIQNAGDAMRERASGTVTFEARCDGGDPCGVILSVSDDGPGMSPEVQRRCMEPYFSTKARGISTGLGLVLVYGLVKEAHGTVSLESQPGVGTTFTLRFPPPPGASDAAPTARHRIARVRLRDARLRSLIAGELKAIGFDVGNDDATPSLVVLDDEADLTAGLDGASVLLLSDCPPTVATKGRLQVIAGRPGLAKIREALRAAAQQTETPAPDATASN
jgi:PAS domain S-box-containing protein